MLKGLINLIKICVIFFIVFFYWKLRLDLIDYLFKLLNKFMVFIEILVFFKIVVWERLRDFIVMLRNIILKLIIDFWFIIYDWIKSF